MSATAKVALGKSAWDRVAVEDATMTFKTSMTALGLVAGMLSAPGLAFGADASTLKGMIISHDGSKIVVRGSEGDTPVMLTGQTAIRGTSGALGIRGEDHPPGDLIRGLPVEVTTVQDGTQVTATDVTFKNSDLKTARQISAGLVGTDANVAANAERIDNVGLLVPAGRTKVFFATGSTTLTEQAKQDLHLIAAQAKGIKGAYRLAVVGRADTTGNAAANQRLSEARAAAVTDYLQQSAGVSPANFIPAAALGSAAVAQDPDPPKNAADARRVTVTIAVSKSNEQASAQ
jgi:outer membrane protein OmpA-like peptidoglycan-associated protein